MELTLNKYLTPCDDCGKQVSNGYIIKSEKNVIRIHLCPACLQKLLSGQIKEGYNLDKDPCVLVLSNGKFKDLTKEETIKLVKTEISYRVKTGVENPPQNNITSKTQIKELILYFDSHEGEYHWITLTNYKKNCPVIIIGKNKKVQEVKTFVQRRVYGK